MNPQMIFESLKTASLTFVRLSHYVTALTPIQRLSVMTKMKADTNVERFFIVLGIISIVLLSAMLVAVTISKAVYLKNQQRNVFKELSKKTGLNLQQQALIKKIARNGRLAAVNLLFSDMKLFDKAANRLLGKFAHENSNVKQINEMKLEMSFLREKLGFRKQFTLSAINKKASKITTDSQVRPNRRRFVRVPVRKEAYIAAFNFERQMGFSRDTGQQADFDDKSLLPGFSRAILTEIGGPGLRFESDMAVEKGDRLLVVFGLAARGRFAEQKLGTEFAHSKKRLIQDIAVVRNIRKTSGSRSFAVELAGLNENDVNGLVRATNAELISNARAKNSLTEYENNRLINSFVQS